MNPHNAVFMSGRLVADPRIKYIRNGRLAMARTSIACKTRFGPGENVDFFDVVAFGGVAEKFVKYMTKGSAVALCGHLSQHKFVDYDNRKRQKVNIILQSFNRTVFDTHLHKKWVKKYAEEEARLREEYNMPWDIHPDDIPVEI